MSANRSIEAYLDATSQFADLDGMRVHFRRFGSGPTLLLLHGSGSSLHSFTTVADQLSATHEIVLVDLPGFGLTGPRPDRDYRIETYVGFVARFMTELGAEQFSIAGSSLGGNIAWNLTLDYPERVQRLVLMNATGFPEKTLPAAIRLARNPLARPVLRHWAPRGAIARNLRSAVGPASVTVVDDALIDRVYALASLPGNRGAFVDLANTDQCDRSASIPEITSPTLVLRGDSIDGQHFADMIAGSTDHVLDGIGHLMPEEAPTEVAAAITTHLAPLRSGYDRPGVSG